MLPNKGWKWRQSCLIAFIFVLRRSKRIEGYLKQLEISLSKQL